MAGRTRRGGLLVGASALAAALAFMGAPAATAQDIGWASVADIDNYAWIDRADSMNEAIGESPPDFAFTYDGQEVWAWTLGDGSALIVEQQWDGPRSYYFDAGSDAPFLVRRAASDAPGTQGEVEVAGPQLSFGYARGAVAIVYTDDGGVLRPEHAGMYTGEALADWERGRQLRRAMRNRPVWRDVSVSLWFDFGTYWFDWNRRWNDGKRRHAGWWKHRNRPGWDRWHHRYDGERQRRRDQAERFRRWREGGFQGRPPGRYRPPSGDWTGGRPRPGNGANDGRPRGRFVDGVMGTRPRPNPPGQGSGTEAANPRPPRGNRNWSGRPRPGAAVPTPAPAPGAVVAPPAPPSPPVVRPDRPTRPGWGGARPRPVPMPAPDAVAPPAPPAPSVGRPERPDRPAYFPRGERPVRVAPNPGGNGFGGRPAPAARPSFTPPAPAPRSFTPPPAPAYRAPPPPPPTAPVYRAPPPPPPPASPRVERSIDNR